jgi:hypothetical protein
MPEILPNGKLQTDTEAVRNVSGRVYGAILADTTALGAIKVASRQHGMLAVVAPAALWVFDKNSVTAGSGTVIVPVAGSGRWLKTT